MREALTVLLTTLALLVFDRPVAAQADRAVNNPPADVPETLTSSRPGRQSATDYERAPVASSQSRTAPRHYYGWQTVTLDVLWLSGLVVAGILDSPVLAWSSLGLGVLGVPLVHVAHGNYAWSGISLGLRVAAWASIGLGIVLAVRDLFDDSSNNGSVDAVLGGSLAVLGAAGIIAIVIIDANIAFVPRSENSTGTVRLTPMFNLRGVVGMQLTTKL